MGAESGDDKNTIVSVFRNRWVKFALIGLPCLALVLWVTYRLRGVLIPFGLAVVGAYVVNPVVEFVQARTKWGRVPVVVALVIALTVVLVLAAGLGLYYTVTTMRGMVPAAQDALEKGGQPGGWIEQLRELLKKPPGEPGIDGPWQPEDLPKLLRENIREILRSALRGAAAFGSSLLGIVLAGFNFVVFFVVMAYVLADLPRIREGVEELLPLKHKAEILRISGEIDTNLRAFFRGQGLVALALGVIYSIGLMLCGVDFGLLIGMVAGLANIVPYLGIAVGLTPALLLSVFPYTGIWPPIGVVAVFVIGQTIEGLYLTPKIIGRNVGLNPVVVILAVMIFGQLFGFLGIIFAVPLAAVVKVLAGDWLRRYKARQASEASTEGAEEE